MKRFFIFLTAIALSLAMAGVADSQCANGVCRPPRQQWRASPQVALQEYHQAVCRIYVDNGRGRRSIGSGVLVRYLGRFVVLTARHVIHGRRGLIHVRWGRGREVIWHQAKVIAEDATWDCAALEVTEPDGIKPAELAWGEAATPKPGDILESCGFGRNDTLQPNRGRLLRFMQPRNATSGDWLEMSGRSRDGDSGGPIFDSAGRVVGILWGTDGAATLGTQGGRVHAMLTSAVRRRPRLPFGGRVVPVLPLVRPIQPRQPVQPPQVTVQPDPTLAPALRGIGDNVAKIEVNTRPPVEEEFKKRETTPIGSALCILGALSLGFVLFYVVGKQ